MRTFFKTARFVFVFCATIFLIEALYFLWIATRPSDSYSQVDAIVVFAGSSNRIRHAYDLAKKGIARTLIISPAGKRLINLYEKRYGVPENVAYILEEKAETTYTNALYVARLIQENHLSSVLLVTADYHMPRSFFLFKLALLGVDCRIGMSKLDTWGRISANQSRRINWLKMTYNEMVQLWGSLLEGGLNSMGGPNAWLRQRSSGMTRWLRKHLLFKVPCLDCG